MSDDVYNGDSTTEFDKNEFLEIFTEEAKDILTSLNTDIIRLREDINNKEILHEIERNIHTLKGAAKMVGLIQVSDIAHKIEDLTSKVRKDEVKIDDDIIDIILKCFDSIQKITESISSNDYDNDTADGVLKDFNDSYKSLDLSKIVPVSDSGEADNEVDTNTTNVKEDMTPEAEQSKDLHNTQKLNEQIKNQKPHTQQPEAKSSAQSNRSKKSVESVKIDINKVEGLIRLSGEFLININKSEREYNNLLDLYDKIESISKVNIFVDKYKSIFDAVFKKLNKYNEFKEFVDNVSYADELKKVFNKAIDDFYSNYHDRQQLVDNLKDRVINLRLIAVSHAVNMFPRMVYDISRELDKDIKFTISGEHTEIDKKILDTIRNPLTHLIRNAIYHGIEPAEERVKKGKPEQGKLELNAYSLGGFIYIDVIDDGRGIDSNSIMRKAIEKGLVSKEESKLLEENEIIEFIFKEGFSTSEDVNDISGRGIGMGAVRKSVEDIQGSISITSKPDYGTKISLKLPLSIAITKLLIVMANGATFALPVSHIEICLTIKEKDIKQVGDKYCFIFGEKVISLVNLGKLLKLKEQGNDYDKRLDVVVINTQNMYIGFIVDRVITERDAIVTQPKGYISRIDIVLGTTILGGGDVIIVLNVFELAGLAKEFKVKSSKKDELDEKQETRVLLVEDSLSIREIERNILEAHGFIVDIASDGDEAWSLLKSENTYKLIISDIEMPNMDGFELTEKVKQDPDLKDIPIIFVTTHENEEEKEKALSIGVEEYIKKSEFNPELFWKKASSLI